LTESADAKAFKVRILFLAPKQLRQSTAVDLPIRYANRKLNNEISIIYFHCPYFVLRIFTLFSHAILVKILQFNMNLSSKLPTTFFSDLQSLCRWTPMFIPMIRTHTKTTETDY